MYNPVKICGSLSEWTLGFLTCSSGWQRPTERGERMAQESTGSEQIRGIIVEEFDYRKINKKSRLRKWLNLKDGFRCCKAREQLVWSCGALTPVTRMRWSFFSTRDQYPLQLASIAALSGRRLIEKPARLFRIVIKSTHTGPDLLIIISSSAKQKERSPFPAPLATYLLVLVARSGVKSVVRRKNRSRPYQVIRELLSSASPLP